VNANVRLVVRIGANVTTLLVPLIMAPRGCPPEPVIKTGSRADMPGGRSMVTRRIVRALPQPMVSVGRWSWLLAIQLVAGLPSNADLA
jgi:hypothetical protein